MQNMCYLGGGGRVGGCEGSVRKKGCEGRDIK